MKNIILFSSLFFVTFSLYAQVDSTSCSTIVIGNDKEIPAFIHGIESGYLFYQRCRDTITHRYSIPVSYIKFIKGTRGFQDSLELQKANLSKSDAPISKGKQLKELRFKKRSFLIGSSTNLMGNLTQLGAGGSSNNVGIQFGSYKTTYLNDNGQETESEIKITAFNFNPSVGYMVSNNVLIGLSVGLFKYIEKAAGDKESFTTYSIAPNVRAYFAKEGKVLPFAEIRGGIISMKYSGDEEADTAPFFNIKGGTAIFLNTKVSLDIFVDYTFSKDSYETSFGGKTTTKQGLFGFGLGVSVFL
jgi:hypothetical protein